MSYCLQDEWTCFFGLGMENRAIDNAVSLVTTGLDLI